MRSLSVVIPVYCEEQGIESFHQRLTEVLDKLNMKLQLIYVNDGSTDATHIKLERIAKDTPSVEVIEFSKNFGKESAIQAGLQAAEGDCVVVIDADLQHPPSLIPEMISYWNNGADIVNAVKIERQKESLPARLFADGYYYLLSKSTGMNLSGSSDFKLLDKSVVSELLRVTEKRPFFRALTMWAGYDQQFIEFIPADRNSGKSKFGFSLKIKLAIVSLTNFSSTPIKFIAWLFLAFFISATYVTIQILQSVVSNQAATGFPTVLLLQLWIATVILASQAITAIYVYNIFIEVRSRPSFLIKKDTDLDRDSFDQ